MLHLTKVAVGCADIETLARRMAARVAADGEAFIFTRYRPKRADEMAGGSLYWIIRHALVARQAILGFDEAADGEGRPRIRIRLGADVVPVIPRPRRAHQGWRYLRPDDAPPDLAAAADSGAEALPPALLSTLSSLGLV